MSDHEWPPLSPCIRDYEVAAPLRPGHLFDGFLKLRQGCEVAALDYSLPIPRTVLFLRDLLAWGRACFSRVLGGTIQRHPLVHLLVTGPFMF